MANNVWFYSIGVGDAFTVKHFFVHCLFHVDGREFLVDAPPYMGKMWAENNANGDEQIDLDRYREIFITHMHADHVGGLEELAYFQMYKTDNPIKLYAPGWLLAEIWSHLRPALEPSVRAGGGLANFDWFFEPIALDTPEVSGLQGEPSRDFGEFSDETSPKTALLVECGQHWSLAARDVALDTALRFLIAVDVIDPHWAIARLSARAVPQRFIRVTDAITITSSDFRFHSPFEGMEVIPKAGTVIANDGDHDIATPYDDCVLIMPSRRMVVGQTAVRFGRFEA